MRKLWKFGIFAVLCAVPVCAQQSSNNQPAADANDALLQKVRELEDRVIALEGQLRLMKSVPTPASPVPATTAPEPLAVVTAAPGGESTQGGILGGAGGSAAKALNPDISAIGDFIAVAGHNTVDPSPSLQMHESELGFQAIIDPYARGDFFLSFGRRG